MNDVPDVRTRFAPSPTGALHVGSARTALFNWLFARHSGGEFILRIEDTDVERSAVEYEAAIIRDLRWLGLDWDEGPGAGGTRGPYRQTERAGLYRDEAERLVAAGAAYRCYCTHERLEELKKAQAAENLPPRYDGRCRGLKEDERPGGDVPYVLRFRVPDRKVAFTDMVHGPLEFDSAAIGDFIIIASDGLATYNFAAVVDDAAMAITHVLRGDDHLSNTARQILVFDALGYDPPVFCHLPLVLGPDRAPLGKRHGGSTIKELRKEGFLPLAVVNALARLGWSPGEGLLALPELAGAFIAGRLSKSPSVFDIDRLKAFNRQAIEAAPVDGLSSLVAEHLRGVDPERLRTVVESVRANASTMKELTGLAAPFLAELHLDEQTRAELGKPGAQKALKTLRDEAEKVGELDGGTAGEVLKRVREAAGIKGRELFMPIRLALTGQDHGIELARVLELTGKRKLIDRIERVLV